MANLILSIFERVITILMFIALAVALVCKKKSKKVPLFIIRPIFLVGLLFIMFQAVFVQRNFSSLDKAIRAYDIKAKPITTLQDEKSTYVIMDEDGSIEGRIFPKNGCVFLRNFQVKVPKRQVPVSGTYRIQCS